MRYLIMLVTLLFSTSAMADMPSYLKDATVAVTLKSGKTYTYRAEDMAVVKRSSMKLPIVKQVFQAINDKKLILNRKNRVYLLAGLGSTGKLHATTDGSRQRKGVIGGIGYQRRVDDVSVGIQTQDNGTTSVTFGKDF